MSNGVTAPETSGPSTTPETSGASLHLTTKRREWWGWFGSIFWLFFMMYGYDVLLMPELSLTETIDYSHYPFFFMVVFALSVIVFGLCFGDNPQGLSRIAIYTTPVAIIITALFALLPNPLGSVLYAVAPVFMAPALARRVFGIIQTAPSGKQLTRYMSCITVCVVLFTICTIIQPPKEIVFLIPAVAALPVWIGIRRGIALTNMSTSIGAFKLSGKLIITLIGAVFLLFWLDTLNAIIHTQIIIVGNEASEIVLTILGFILPPVGFLLWGIISDKGHERKGFICGMMLFVAGILIALIPGDQQLPWLIPLAISTGLGGSYAEFFILTAPVYFLIHTRRPVFTATLGVVFNLIMSALLWEIEFWLPDFMMSVNAFSLVSAAISAIGFVLLAYLLFERHKEKTLVAALCAFLNDGVNPISPMAEPLQSSIQSSIQPTSPLPSPSSLPPPLQSEVKPQETEKQIMEDAGLTQTEINFAMLLLDGSSRSMITRKLQLSADAADNCMDAILGKIGGDPVFYSIVKNFKLTGSETRVLRCLRNSMTNPQIAVELQISENTVKTQVRSLMRKLPQKDRKQIPAWLEEYKPETT